MKQDERVCLKEALGAFDFKGKVEDVRRFGEGHINDTFAVSVSEADGKDAAYILQKINKDIFTNPEQVMENILGVTEFLKKRIHENGGDPDRETLTVICDRSGKSCFQDSHGEYWRVYPYIENTVCLQRVEIPEQFYESARSFGRFIRLLGDYPAETLHETIPHFHDTPKRLEALKQAAANDWMGRCAECSQEIQFVLEREAMCSHLTNQLSEGILPLRVTHNDTKLNNILLDVITRKGICIIDLDTIMPGLAAYDFGDSIRFGASTAAEDEPNLELVHFDQELYRIYLKGYLEEAGEILTDAEKKSLPWGAKMMTLECGIRFLTDYLEGDVYFKTTRDRQNLDRARTQFRLLSEMESCI